MRPVVTADATPTPPHANATPSEAAQRWLRALTAAQRAPLQRTTAAGVAAAAAVIAQALLVAWLVHAVAIDGLALSALVAPAAALVAATVLRALARNVQLRLGHHAAAAATASLRADLLQRLHAAGPARLAQWHHADLSARLLDSVDALHNYIAHYLPQRQLAVAVPLMIAAVALLHDWLAALLLLLTAPLIPLFMALVGWGAQRLAERFEQQRNRAAAVFLDRIRGLTTIRLFGAEATAAAQIRDHADSLRRDSMRVLRVAFLSSAVLEFFAAVAIAAVAIYVGLGLLGYVNFGPAPQLSLYSGLAVLLLAPEFFAPLRQFAVHYHDRADALGAAEQLLTLPDTGFDNVVADIAPRSTASETPATVAEMRHVDLDREHGPVLRDFSLRLPAGELVLLSGPSGCGKTSVLHLLAGHLQPDAGTLAVHTAFAWLGQRPFIAHGSLRRNIALGAPGAGADAIDDAARRAGVLDFAAQLPDGLDTRLGDHGLGLSGGQAQRVALARAWLSSAPLLLLDEPSTGLDPAAVDALAAQLHALRDAGRTVVVASHDPRLHTAADLVIAMGSAAR